MDGIETLNGEIMRKADNYFFKFPDYRSGVFNATTAYAKVTAIPRDKNPAGIMMHISSSKTIYVAITQIGRHDDVNDTHASMNSATADSWFFIPHGYEVYVKQTANSTRVSVSGWERDG